MAVKFTRRIPTVQYGYDEVEADSFEEFVEAVAAAEDFLSNSTGDPAQDKAIGALQKGGLVKSGQGFRGNSAKPGFGNKAATEPSSEDPIELGDHEGYTIKVYPKGKFGPYVNAYQKGADPERVNANLPKGMSPDQVTLEIAVEAILAKVNGDQA